MLHECSAALADAVQEGKRAERYRGFAGLVGYVRQSCGPGWALVGDAGYHRDPVTGHGITDAFRDAELLANAVDVTLRAGDAGCELEALTAYQLRRDTALRETFEITRALSAFPNPERFVELQIQLSDALEREAADLAAQPAPLGTAMAA